MSGRNSVHLVVWLVTNNIGSKGEKDFTEIWDKIDYIKLVKNFLSKRS